jgi:WD40 repeat protein
MIVCCSNKCIKFFDGSNFEEVKQLEIEYNFCFCLSPNGNLLAIGGTDIKLFDIKNDKYIITLQGHSDWVI